MQTPEEVAAQIVAAVEKGRAVVETTAFVRAAAGLARMAPGIYRRVTERMARKGHA